MAKSTVFKKLFRNGKYSGVRGRKIPAGRGGDCGVFRYNSTITPREAGMLLNISIRYCAV